MGKYRRSLSRSPIPHDEHKTTMNSQAEADKLTQAERDLVNNFRQTKPDKRDSFLSLSADYCRVFPLDMPRLRLVAAG